MQTPGGKKKDKLRGNMFSPCVTRAIRNVLETVALTETVGEGPGMRKINWYEESWELRELIRDEWVN